MDGEEERQDKQTSDEQTQTSEQEPKTFTEEEVVARETKAKNDALAAAGRDVKSIAEQRKAAEGVVKSANEAKKAARSARDEAELERAGEDKVEIRAVKAEIKARKAEEELADANAELTAEKEKSNTLNDEVGKSTKEQNAREVAEQYSVNQELLTKYTDGTKEAMEDLAKSLPKKTEPIKTDSGKTSGGSGGIPTDKAKFEQWISGLPQDEFEKRSEEINKMMKEGKIK